MIKELIGTVQKGTIDRQVEKGYLLLIYGEHILLPFEDTDYFIDDDEAIEVFIYYDRNDQVRATTILPKIRKEEYGWAKVVKVVPQLGVFVDIGIDKDMLVTRDNLPSLRTVWPVEEDKLFVKLDLDHQERLIAIPAEERIFFERREIATDDLFNQTISGRVYLAQREGTAFISDEGYRGFIHRSEREVEPRLGEYITGRVIDVKEDGTINASLLPLKQDRIESDAKHILQKLKEAEGVIPFDDYSDPEAIRKTFGFSKSAFKRALGHLMKRGIVKQQDGQTFLMKED